MVLLFQFTIQGAFTYSQCFGSFSPVAIINFKRLLNEKLFSLFERGDFFPVKKAFDCGILTFIWIQLYLAREIGITDPKRTVVHLFSDVVRYIIWVEDRKSTRLNSSH